MNNWKEFRRCLKLAKNNASHYGHTRDRFWYWMGFMRGFAEGFTTTFSAEFKKAYHEGRTK